MKQAMQGMKVIDLTRVVSGPYCTYQLALMGADCIKIEEPGKGDAARYSGAGSTAYYRDRLLAFHHARSAARGGPCDFPEARRIGGRGR
jgi:CoA:oxalate CoA-transferase